MTVKFSARTAEEIWSGGDPGPRGSSGKLPASHQAQFPARLRGSLTGPEVIAWPENDESQQRLAKLLLAQPRFRIDGGTDEIQRTIIAERILGLPKERTICRAR
jgi:hypothetical protein